MRSLEARINLITVAAASKYGPLIDDTERLLLELVESVKQLEPVPKRTLWPSDVVLYLARRQKDRCPACRKPLPDLNTGLHHIDHVVPWILGGDNSPDNLQLLHARCNLVKGHECAPEHLIQYLQGRLLNLRKNHAID